MMTPSELGMPEKFSQWNHYQWDAIEEVSEHLASGTKYVASSIPVGGGKTGIGMGLGLFLRAAGMIERFAYLTPGKILQDQIVADFSRTKVTDTRMVDMRGRDNYQCKSANYRRTCKQMDKRCGLTNAKTLEVRNQCPYRYQQFVCSTNPQFSTNYAYWLAAGDTLAPVDLVICDEVHQLEDAMTNALQVELGGDHYHLDYRLMELDPDFVKDLTVKSAKEIGETATQALAMIKDQIEDGGYYNSEESEYLTGDDGLLDRLYKASRCVDGNWVHDSNQKTGARLLQPIWVGKYSNIVWGGAKYVWLTSGTINPTSLKYLGISKEQSVYKEWPYVFPTENSPIYWVKTADMTDRATKANPSNINVWLSRADQIMGPRMGMGRSGIFHTVSFDRAKIVMERSKYRDSLITNVPGYRWKSTAEAIKEFVTRAANGEGVGMVSPSISTGQDFRDDLCRWNILGKVPFEPGKTPLMKARREQDSMYVNNRTAQTMMQQVGRGTRNATDWCENFIIDDSIGWFKYRYPGLFQKWFKIRDVSTVPGPLRRES